MLARLVGRFFTVLRMNFPVMLIAENICGLWLDMQISAQVQLPLFARICSTQSIGTGRHTSARNRYVCPYLQPVCYECVTSLRSAHWLAKQPEIGGALSCQRMLAFLFKVEFRLVLEFLVYKMYKEVWEACILYCLVINGLLLLLLFYSHYTGRLVLASYQELEDFAGAKFYCPHVLAYSVQHIWIREKMLEFFSKMLLALPLYHHGWDRQVYWK